MHGKKELFLEGANGLDQEKECEANSFSESEFIAPAEFTKFIAMGDYSKQAITTFAKHVGIAPGIVVGPLQFRELLPVNFCNDLKQKLKWVNE